MGTWPTKTTTKINFFFILSKNNIKLYPRFLQGNSCLVLWNSLWICIHASQHVEFPLGFQQSILFTVAQHTVDSIMIKIWSHIQTSQDTKQCNGDLHEVCTAEILISGYLIQKNTPIGFLVFLLPIFSWSERYINKFGKKSARLYLFKSTHWLPWPQIHQAFPRRLDKSNVIVLLANTRINAL